MNASPPFSDIETPPVLSGPFWGELRIFLAVAKSRSFNRAAEQLQMSQPTVSRQVRRLQDILGAQLVIATQAGIQLTKQGEELAKSLGDLDQKLFDISSDLNAETRAAEGTVRLVMSEAMSGLFVIPEIASFSELYPQIRLQICAPKDKFSFRANQADIMLSPIEPQENDLIARKVGFLHLLPVANQIYVKRYGLPTPDNLSSHCFLQVENLTRPVELWQPWLDLVSRGIATHTCDNLLSYALMVRNGLGIGLTSTTALTDPTAIPLDLGVHIRPRLHLISSADRLNTRVVQIVADWLANLFSEQIPWFAADLQIERLPRYSMAPTINRLLEGLKG